MLIDTRRLFLIAKFRVFFERAPFHAHPVEYIGASTARPLPVDSCDSRAIPPGYKGPRAPLNADRKTAHTRQRLPEIYPVLPTRYPVPEFHPPSCRPVARRARTALRRLRNCGCPNTELRDSFEEPHREDSIQSPFQKSRWRRS